MKEPEREPRKSEPWKIASDDGRFIYNTRDEVVAVSAEGEREARRIVAAVNAVSRISTEALEDGIVERGLDCLFQLYRYHTDEGYRTEIEEGDGLRGILSAGKDVASALAARLGSSFSR